MADEDIAQIPQILACNVGNTRLSFAHVQGDTVTPQQSFRIGELGKLAGPMKELWESIPEPKKIVAASVNPAGLKALEAIVDETLQQSVLVVGRDMPLPIETDLPHHEQIGVDRLCAAVAAYDRIGSACVVADFGTAITIDCVNDAGVFLGGAIMPGLSMSAAGLHAGTAQLPQVELAEVNWVFGKDTAQAIVGGIVRGAHGALREFVEVYATELGHWPTVILTGGDANLICPNVEESDLVQAIVDDLVLRGAAAAYYRTVVK